MNILFYGLFCSDDIFDNYLKLNPNPYSVAHRLLEENILSELEKEYNINHIYIWQGKSESKYINGEFEYSKKTHSKFLRYFNLPFIKFLSIFLSTFLTSMKWKIKNRGTKNSYIVSSINYFPVALANYFVSKICHIKNIIILTDTSVSNAYSKKSTDSYLKYLCKIQYQKIIHWLECNYDAYIFLSNYMNQKINIHSKPWCLIEGIYHDNATNFTSFPKSKAVMYAGTINRNLGIDKLVEGFKKTKNPDIELWLFGKGDFEKELKEMISDDNRIKYFGFMKHDEILEYERKCSLLINTRNPKDEYTKLSFPSKTMEYLASGTPFMTTKLECYPSEYDDYLLYIDEYDTECIQKNIEKYFEYSEEYRSQLGMKNRMFILKNKNKQIQVKKMISVLHDLK